MQVESWECMLLDVEENDFFFCNFDQACAINSHEEVYYFTISFHETDTFVRKIIELH